MDISESSGYGVVGTIFALYGLNMMVTGKGRIGFGRPALQTFEVTGLLAKIVGGSIFIGSMLFASPFIFALLSPSSSLTDRLPFFGVILMVTGVFFGFILQSAISLGQALYSRKNEASAHHE